MSPTRTRTSLIAAVVALIIGGGSNGALRLAAASSPPLATATSVVPVAPYRILDTRNGIGAPADPVTERETIDVQIAGVGPVPADAVGVVLNVTGTRTTEATYITAWPTGTQQTDTSVLNLTPGIDAPNAVTALLGDGGRLSLFNFTGSTDLVADVAGYLVASEGGTTGPPGPAGPAGEPASDDWIPRVASIELPDATTSATTATQVGRFTTTAPAAGVLVVSAEPHVWLNADAASAAARSAFGLVWLCTAPSTNTSAACGSVRVVSQQDADNADAGNTGEHLALTRVIPVDAGPTTLYLNAATSDATEPLNLYPTTVTVTWLPVTDTLPVTVG